MRLALVISLLLTAAAAGSPAGAAAAAGPRLIVNVNLDRHHISVDIYGVNFADTAPDPCGIRRTRTRAGSATSPLAASQ